MPRLETSGGTFPLEVGQRLLDRDGDDRRNDRRRERDMRPVAEHQLQGVLTRRKGQHRLGLSAAEMHVLFVHRQRSLRLFVRQFGVDEKVMVAGLVLLNAGRRNAHAGKAKLYLEWARNRFVVLEVYEIDAGARWRRRLRL